MSYTEKRDDVLRFKYHAPVPDFYKVKNPENPLKIISKDALKEFEAEILKEGFTGFTYSYLDEKDYSCFQKDSKYVIILKFPISVEILEMEPSRQKVINMDAEFQWLAESLFRLCDYLRGLGFACELVNPLSEKISLKSLAVKSNEAIITRSNLCLFEDGLTNTIFALACSIENLPIKEANDLLWVLKHCSGCGKCIKVCPHSAFDENEKVIPRKCLAHRKGCSECMLICPFLKDDFNLLKEKFSK